MTRSARISVCCMFPLALALGCEDKPAPSTASSAPAKTASAPAKAPSVVTAQPTASPVAKPPPPPVATSAAAPQASGAPDPAGTLDYADLLKKVKEKKADWIGKEVVVRGPNQAQYESADKKQGFTYPDVGTPADSIKVLLKNPADMSKISPLGTGEAIVVAKGKIKDYSLGDLVIVDAEILSIRKK